jgi:phage terminase Nu1 subunit (DNA packaging protein)
MEAPKKLHRPVFDHNGKAFSPAQILALERAELTRIRVKRDSMYLALERDQLVQTELVTRQAAALFLAVRQKLLAIPHNLSPRLVGKDHRAIHEALTTEIHKALREMADFEQEQRS